MEHAKPRHIPPPAKAVPLDAETESAPEEPK